MIKRHQQMTTETVALVKEYLTYNNDGSLRWIKSPTKFIDPGYRAGRRHVNGHIEVCLNKRYYMAHHLVWLLHYGKMPDSELKHINGNKADNRIDNLILSSRKKSNVSDETLSRT